VIVFVRQLGDKEYSFIWNGWMKIAVFEGLNVVEWVWIYGTSCSICTLRLLTRENGKEILCKG
jgi:hypothetical protein